MIVKTIILTMFLWLLALPPAEACEMGPDFTSAAALDAATGAQRVVAEHLIMVDEDRHSRRFYSLVEPEAYEERRTHGQISMLLNTSGVAGFRVCDARDTVPARLDRQQLGLGMSLGYRRVVRFDGRLFGVSDSILQTDTSPYAPPREDGATAVVPGAGGLGQGMWALRLELFELFAASVGRVRDQSIAHKVGWQMEYDDEGNPIGLEETNTTSWSGFDGPRSARWFVTVGAPEWASTELIIGAEKLEQLGLASGWYRLGTWPVELRGAARWDGVIRQPLAEMGVGTAPISSVPDLRFSALSATELAIPRIRELSARVSLTKNWSEFIDFGGPADLDFFEVQARAGVSGGSRLVEGIDQALAPGVDVQASVAIPIYIILRLGGYVGVNRPETVATIPLAVGRPEWGASVYTTYAF